MQYTFKIHKAIRFSVKIHDVYQKQKRKGKKEIKIHFFAKLFS